MKRIQFVTILILSILALASCSKDKSASLEFERTALYFSSWNDAPQTISYVATNAQTVGVVSCSPGWSASVNMASSTITVQPVGLHEETSEEDLKTSGYVNINALNKENEATSYQINVYISQTIELDEAGAANCYVITTPQLNYTFDVMHRPDGVALDTKNATLLWQSNPEAVKGVVFIDGKVLFFIPSSDEDESRVKDTNAVIAAYNGAGEVIWSWHLWIVNENPLTDYVTFTNESGNSMVTMNKNLGAFTNSNGDSDSQKIIDSYGMYYQWGRKDPFPRPLYYNASGAYDEDRYDISGVYIPEVQVERTSSNGTIDYTIKNPMVFITTADDLNGEERGSCDWLATADNRAWNDDEKSLYDPCPYGWRVPTAEDLLMLHLSEKEDNTPLDIARGQYGWELTDGNTSSFWSACGRRRYVDGKVENMNYYEGENGNYPPQPEPWEGYYWSSSVAGDGGALSLYFDLKTTRTINKFEPNASNYRANAFQVRCVKR